MASDQKAVVGSRHVGGVTASGRCGQGRESAPPGAAAGQTHRRDRRPLSGCPGACPGPGFGAGATVAGRCKRLSQADAATRPRRQLTVSVPLRRRIQLCAAFGTFGAIVLRYEQPPGLASTASTFALDSVSWACPLDVIRRPYLPLRACGQRHAPAKKRKPHRRRA